MGGPISGCHVGVAFGGTRLAGATCLAPLATVATHHLPLVCSSVQRNSQRQGLLRIAVLVPGGASVLQRLDAFLSCRGIETAAVPTPGRVALIEADVSRLRRFVRVRDGCTADAASPVGPLSLSPLVHNCCCRSTQPLKPTEIWPRPQISHALVSYGSKLHA